MARRRKGAGRGAAPGPQAPPRGAIAALPCAEGRGARAVPAMGIAGILKLGLDGVSHIAYHLASDRTATAPGVAIQSGTGGFSMSHPHSLAAAGKVALAAVALLLARPEGYQAAAGKADDTLRLAWGGAAGPLETADVYFTNSRTGIWLSQHVWDALVYRNPETFAYEPLLATAWRWVDAVTLELKLREGVRFHNGEAFDADDVVYTLSWAIKPDSGVLKKRETGWIKEVQKVDATTVRIIAKSVFPPALDFLATLPIYPDEYYAKVGREGMAARPVGTGPYKVVGIRPAQEYRLERNAEYGWGSPKGTAKIKNVVIREIQDLQTQVAELLSGGIDLTADLTSDHIDRLKRMPQVATVTGETMRVGYLGLDAAGRSGSDALKDPRVRRAIHHAFDRAAYVKAYLGDAARLINVTCYPTQLGCDQSAAVAYPYDPEKAKVLLAEAGLAKGFEIELYTVPQIWIEPVVADLAKVGIKVTLRLMPWGSLSPRINEGKVPFLADNHGSWSINDASASVGYFFAGGPNDYARDAEVTAWLATADSTADPAQREELYRKAIRRVTEQAYHVPISTHVRHYAAAPGLSITPYPDEIIRIFNYSWK